MTLSAPLLDLLRSMSRGKKVYKRSNLFWQSDCSFQAHYGRTPRDRAHTRVIIPLGPKQQQQKH